MADLIEELKRLNDEQLNDAMLLAGECAILRESIRALKAENLRLQAQVAELRGAASQVHEWLIQLEDGVDKVVLDDEETLRLVMFAIKNHAQAHETVLRRALASDGSKLLEVAKAAGKLLNAVDEYMDSEDASILELPEPLENLRDALTEWRGEE